MNDDAIKEKPHPKKDDNLSFDQLCEHVKIKILNREFGPVEQGGPDNEIDCFNIYCDQCNKYYYCYIDYTKIEYEDATWFYDEDKALKKRDIL